MAARSELDVVVQGQDKLSPTLDQIQSRLIRLVGFISSTMTALSIASFPIAAIRGFEKEMAGVQKTTGFTDGQIKTLSGSLIDLSRRINVSAEDLAKIAASAGQQGLGREGVAGITQFTESVSRMASVLDITVEEAGTNVGKIASIFKIPLKDIENAVSAFNEVANNSTASGEQLLDVVKRIGDAAGSLNLEQSIGLSATGIDLGLSPEVVGSSFQKVFAEMYARAGQFSKLLGTNVNDWMKTVQNDGIGALKQYLAALRKMTPEAQQQTIKALSGGGRIGSLVTKLLMDTEDTILDTNVQNAVNGITTGTSAIKEQLTVLATLDAQIVKAGNSFKALGIMAGDVFGSRLAAYFGQLNDALANPAVINFAKAVGAAFLDLFDTIAGGIKFLAGLNIQWTSFITVAKVFIALKLAQALSGMLFQLPALAAGWLGLANSAATAAAAEANAAGRMSTSLATQLAQLKLLIAGYTEYQGALAAERAALAANTTAQASNTAAAAQAAQARAALAAGLLTQRSAGKGVSAAKSGVAAAQASAAAKTAAVQATLDAKLVAAAQAHATKLQQIEQQRIAAVTAAQASGNAAALAAAESNALALTAVENTRNNKSLAGLAGYYNNRMNIARAAGVVEVNAAKATMAATLSAFDGASRGLGTLQTSAAGATAALNTTRAALAATTAQLTLVQAASVAASRAFSFLATGVRLLATGFGLLVSVLGKLFFWATIVYTALSIFGGLDAVVGVFNKLTDAMGITSERGRELEEQTKRTAEAHKLLKKSADEAADSIANLRKVQDADTGVVSDKSRKLFEIGLGSDDRDVYLKTIDDIVKAAEGAQTELELLDQSKNVGIVKVDDLEKEKVEVLAKIDEYEKTLQTRMGNFQAQKAAGGFGSDKGVKAAEKLLKEQQDLRDEIDNKIRTLQSKDTLAIAGAVDKTKQSLVELEKTLSTTFTPLSAQTFENFAAPYLKAMEEVKAAEANRVVLVQQQANETDEVRKADLEAEVRAAFAKETVAKTLSRQIRIDLANNIAALQATGGLSEATVGSLSVLTEYLEKSDGVIAAILKGILAVKTAGGLFTGENAAPPPKPREGEGTFNQDSASEARRLRSAQLDLEKARLQAESDLQKEANDQKASDNEDFYKENLKSIANYYAERLRLQQADLDIEAKLRRQELAALQDTASQAESPSEKIRIEAQIAKAEGDIKLLEMQRSSLEKDNDRALRDALEEFTDRVTDQKAALVEFFGADAQVAFTASLDSAAAAYRDFVNRLTVEAQGNPELLKIVDQIKLKASFDAVEVGLGAIRREASITSSYLDMTGQKIQALGERGLLTRDEVATLEEKNRQAIIATQEADISAQQTFLDNWVAQEGAAVRTTVAFKELQLEIDEARNKVDLLKIEGDKVAKDINQSINGELSDAFKSLYGENAGDIKAAISDFFVGTLNTLADKASDSLADTLYKALNSAVSSMSGGTFGSLGDMLAPIFKADTAAVEAPTGVLGALSTATDVLGKSPATPLYTQDASAAIAGLTGIDAVAKAGTDTATKVADVADKGFFTDTFKGLGDKIGGFASTVGTGIKDVGVGIGDVFMQGVNGITSFLGPLFSTLIATVAGGDAAGAGASLAGNVAGAAAAHNGGVAGRTTMRRTGVRFPMGDAIKYHTGGKAGLAPNEVPVILEKGEEILTKQDPRHQDNLGSGAGGNSGEGGQGQTTFNVQPVLSESAVLDAFKGSKGQKQLLVVIGKNPAGFRKALGIN